MRTFWISTLGCKVNQYESEQIATLLRRRGLIQVHAPQEADLRVINTCSVTVQAASKSRQSVRQASRGGVVSCELVVGSEMRHPLSSCQRPTTNYQLPTIPRVIVTGCWATSDRAEAAELPGVSAVLGHQDDVARELERLLALWDSEEVVGHAIACHESSAARNSVPYQLPTSSCVQRPESVGNEGWRILAGNPAELAGQSKAHDSSGVKKKIAEEKVGSYELVVGSETRQLPTTNYQLPTSSAGTWSLPVLAGRQSGRQRAFLKVQDGCDAHCTYCVIPKLRPNLRSKGIDEAVQEARALVAAGHVEIVLTGIFLGAYGQATAVRRLVGAGHAPPSLGTRESLESEDRATHASPLHAKRAGHAPPLQRLVDALCTQVPGLRRLRFSSLEPGDLDEGLLATLSRHPQVAPHFHLPLQSGSDVLLRRMNRQYRREDYLRMVQRVREVFDRPALTTDIIVGFPGETDQEFERTLEVVDACRFIHIHAFPFSPRPGTAANRWQKDFVRGPVVNQRMEMLQRRAVDFSYEYRQQFAGETVELLVEKPSAADEEVASRHLAEEGVGSRQLAVGSKTSSALPTANCQPPTIPLTANHSALLQHGRCERYFSVFFEADRPMAGQSVRVRIERVTVGRTMGVVV